VFDADDTMISDATVVPGMRIAVDVAFLASALETIWSPHQRAAILDILNA
jgi:hypothetical protein